MKNNTNNPATINQLLNISRDAEKSPKEKVLDQLATVAYRYHIFFLINQGIQTPAIELEKQKLTAAIETAKEFCLLFCSHGDINEVLNAQFDRAFKKAEEHANAK